MVAVVMRGSLSRFCVFLSGLLLTCGANAQIRNDSLYNDIENGGIEELLLALASGIPVDQEIFLPNSDLSLSLLALTVYSSNDDAAVELLARGARIDSLDGQFYGASNIQVLAQQGMAQTLTAVLDENVGVLAGVGADPLNVAIVYGHPEVLQLLLDRMSAVVNEYEFRDFLDEALTIAALENDTAATEILLERGADSGSGLPLLATVAGCAPDTAEIFFVRATGPLPNYEGEHLAFLAVQRCIGGAARFEDADGNFSRIVELLHEADSSTCEVLRKPDKDHALRVSKVLSDFDLCQ